jgi:phenylalanyl-tRNA synthetase alpha subunit
MKIFLGTFFLSLSFLAFSFGETDTSQNSQKELDQLRKEYLADKAALDQINETKEKILEKNKHQKMPNNGPEWKKALKEWVPLWQKAGASYPKYLNALVAAYCELPQTDKKARELK